MYENKTCVEWRNQNIITRVDESDNHQLCRELIGRKRSAIWKPIEVEKGGPAPAAV